MRIEPLTPDSESRRRTTADIPGLFDVEGFLALFLKACAAGAVERHQPFLDLGAAICCLGALAGRRYESPTGARTNFYGCGMADSSSGKDTGQKLVRLLLSTTNNLKHFVCKDFQSGNGLAHELDAHPALIAVVDEIGIWL